ncbi:MAG: hypothetical protein JNL98_19085 [Bryobacterales bacterium]|nr:hypothetical protein [Bryobacterales bacterium]
MALEAELATFEKLLPSLLTEQGKYAVIHDTGLAGTYGTYEDALKAAYSKFGVNEEFLIKQILGVEQIQFVTRLLPEQCHT